MSQNPFGTQPPGQPPYPQYPQVPSANKSGASTVLIILGIVGGVLLLIAIACGVAGYLIVRKVETNLEGVMAEAMAEFEAEQQLESQFWVDTYRDHPAVQQQLGKITSHQPRSPDWQDESLELEIEVTGEKGSGRLRIEYADLAEAGEEDEDYAYETTMHAFLVNRGNKQLLDSEAGKKYDEWLESE